MKIKHVLAKKGPMVVTVGPDQTIREALGLLAEHNIGALVVIDAARTPVGIVSERDIVRALSRNETILARAVGTIMTRNLIVGTPEDDLTAVGSTMTGRRIRHLPVMAEGALVGIVSIGDVVKAQRDQYQGEVDTLQVQLSEPEA